MLVFNRIIAQSDCGLPAYTSMMRRFPYRWISFSFRKCLCCWLLLQLPVGAQTPPPTAVEKKITIPAVHTSVTITATPVEPAIDHRNGEVFQQTLFSRDDQIFHQLNAGINAGQHEGGGKSIEVRRFGFNLDHGGVSGGRRVSVVEIRPASPSAAARRRSRKWLVP